MFRLARGTKSLLWGAHSMLWHPLIVAFCYWKLYGFPWSPKLWLCFYLHDIGYIGCETMDGDGNKGGKWHPLKGANLIGDMLGTSWMLYCLMHSRSMQKTYYDGLCKDKFWDNVRPKFKISRLCVADKLAVKYTPLFCFNSDELEEYMTDCGIKDVRDFKPWMSEWAEEFVREHKDIANDVSYYGY